MRCRQSSLKQRPVAPAIEESVRCLRGCCRSAQTDQGKEAVDELTYMHQNQKDVGSWSKGEICSFTEPRFPFR
jgi:hypothetical protein